MPVLVLTVAVDLDELLQDRGSTSSTLCSVAERVVVVTVNHAVVLVVRVLGTKDRWADRACEVLNMIFVVECRDVGASKSSSTGLTHKVEAPEIVALTEWILRPIGLCEGEKLGGHNVATVLRKSDEQGRKKV